MIAATGPKLRKPSLTIRRPSYNVPLRQSNSRRDARHGEAESTSAHRRRTGHPASALAQGPSTVRDVQEELRGQPTGYTTALKLLQIMAEKGLVDRDESRRTHVYRAREPEELTQRQLIGDLLERAFGGSAEKLVMQALASKPASAEELAAIRRCSIGSKGVSHEDDRGPADVAGGIPDRVGLAAFPLAVHGGGALLAVMLRRLRRARPNRRYLAACVALAMMVAAAGGDVEPPGASTGLRGFRWIVCTGTSARCDRRCAAGRRDDRSAGRRPAPSGCRRGLSPGPPSGWSPRGSSGSPS